MSDSRTGNSEHIHREQSARDSLARTKHRLTGWWLAAALVLIAAGTLAWQPAKRPEAAVLARVERPGEDPSQNCRECHEEIVTSWSQAPHAKTLRRVDNEEARRPLVGKSVQLGATAFRFEESGQRLWMHSSARKQPASVDWIFGSGHHALTPVTLVPGAKGDSELIQLHVSGYADGHLDVTPGSEVLGKDATDFGILHRSHEARDCIQCHASRVPAESGRIDFDHLVPGVGCNRCHPESANHVASDGDSRTFPDWRGLTAREAINRCGECHRRSDQFTADELRTDNRLIVRFAPVGMAMSACFAANEAPNYSGKFPRFDCVTCHDPHQRASSEASYYVEKCQACHAPPATEAVASRPRLPECPVDPRGQRCLECHMPKTQLLDHLSFTDHWIRIRK